MLLVSDCLKICFTLLAASWLQADSPVSFFIFVGTTRSEAV